MNILSGFKFLEAQTTAKVSSILYNANRGSQLVMQVTGTSTTFSMTVEGKVDLDNGTFEPIATINNKDLSMASTISANGIYSIGVDGYSQIQVNLSSITNGNVNVYGKLGD